MNQHVAPGPPFLDVSVILLEEAGDAFGLQIVQRVANVGDLAWVADMLKAVCGSDD